MAVDEADGRERRLGRRRALGAELRDAFGQVADEPVPAALEELARRLDQGLQLVDGQSSSDETGQRPQRVPAADA